MQEKISLKGNIIKYDETSLDHDISEILNKRFDDPSAIEGTMEDLHDPFLLKDMDKAVERILKAKEDDEKVMIFGDYDVDGVTSTSILMHFFKKIGLKASYRLPHRVNDGYGLKNYFVDECAELGVSLIVTVDCGTRDIGVVKHAKKLGVDIIVTDHHAVPDEIPEEAVAIINPKRKDCNYPFKGLAGAGVAFKLMSALASKLFDANEYEEYLRDSIDICAIGTVADCMTLTGENRIIVIEGLKQLKRSRSNGIRALIEDRIDTDLDADVFGFVIGPRLNAAGRMDSPYKAVNLILNNGETLNKTLSEIEQLNEKRKFLTKQFVDEALEKVNRRDNILFYYSTAIEHGIIGIVAGRLTEQFYRPSIVLKDEGDKLVASCRSPDFFSIVDILEKYKEYFIGFGGHKQAAGFSIKREKFGEFKSKVLADLNSMDFRKHRKEVVVDKIVELNELGFGFLKKINKFKPYGIGNKKPVFMIEDLDYDTVEILGKNSRDHLRFKTKHGYKIFGFGFGEYLDQIKKADKVDLIFDVSEDVWMGKKNLMLKVVDIVIY
ncbi:single-stranded-DNA-specific exonuclease RecJ [Candidatus Gracilibacteria bacterium 28_42_T64]|nr:single-stranded-DNA-specific exonuclease RecJ [Candidatus Gracilibacteria bacterium 28_42_T64]